MNLRRKRLRLMRDTQWRGYARTAEGNPITLSQARSVATLSVLGNSAQDGTPSPDNPVDVVGVGEKTLNLFDVSQITSKSGGYTQNSKIYVKNYYYSASITPEQFLGITGLQIGDTLTCAAQYEQLQSYSTGARYIAFPPKISGLALFKLIDYSDLTNRNNGFSVITIPEDFNHDNYYGLTFYGGNSTAPIEGEVRAIWSNFAIYKGEYTAETLPPYEPYGYKIPVSVTGKNLFTFDEIRPTANVSVEQNMNDYILNNNGYYRYSSTIFRFFNLSPQTQYTLFYKFKVFETEIESGQPSDDKIYSKISDKSGNILDAYSKRYSDISVNTEHSAILNFTTGDISECFFQANLTWGQPRKTKMMISDIMILEGTYTAETIPQYEPYMPPQTLNIYTPQILHGLGDASDTVTIDFDRRKAELVKQYEYFKVDTAQWRGGSTVGYNGINTTNRFHEYTDLYSENYLANDSKCNILQNYNDAIWAKDIQGFVWNSVQLHLRINNDVLGITTSDTAEERTSKFTSYTQNNDIYVLGKLITPVVTDITALQQWETLPNLKGTWILTASGGTKPTLKAEYYSEERSTE